VNLVRILKIILITLLVCLVSVSSLNCASESDSAALSENQVVTVQRGNLTIDITAVGNLELSRKEDLAFDIFYQEATAEEVLVEEGDTVEEGQLLAKLDASEWENELSLLEDKVTAAQRQLTAKQRALIQAELNVEKAEIALYQATFFAWPDAEDAQADVDKAQFYVEYANKRLAEAATEEEETKWARLVAKAERDLALAEENLNLLLSDTTTDEVVIKRAEFRLSEMSVEEARNAIEDAQTAIEDARKDLADAQEDLEDAKSKSPEVRASFDGFIIKVNVEGGDEIKQGHVAVTLADPDKFEAEVMVSEMDILQVKLGGEARVQVDAMTGLILPAEVTHISPTATIQAGVVNYKVKVEIESPKAVQQKGQGLMPTMIPEDFQLREGLTVTVSILVDERTDVLLIPNGAITSSGRQAYVQVVSADGTFEERAIRTGISDWQYTEVTDGLSEGEKVVVPQGATTTSATPQQRRPMMIPGMRPH